MVTQSPVTPRADSTFVNPVDANAAAGVNPQNVVITSELFTRLLEGLVHQSVSVPPVATLPPLVIESPLVDEEDDIVVETPEDGKDKQRKGYTKFKTL